MMFPHVHASYSPTMHCMQVYDSKEGGLQKLEQERVKRSGASVSDMETYARKHLASQFGMEPLPYSPSTCWCSGILCRVHTMS